MQHRSLATTLRAVNSELLLQIADTPDLVHEAHRLRYKVYCLERGYEPGAGNLEIDEFDQHSRHIILKNRQTGDVFGTVRLVIATTADPARSFPMHQVCDPALFRGLPLRSTAEVSRFALSRDRQGLSADATSLARLALVKGVIQLSAAQGVTHWCAIMEPTLLRLLRASAIDFTPMGPLVDYHGLRQPARCEIAPMLARMAEQQPSLWRYVTDNGRHAAECLPHLQAA